MTHAILKKAGSLRGNIRGGVAAGEVFHAAPIAERLLDHDRYTQDVVTAADGIEAVCGAQPRIQWSTQPGTEVNCPKCLRKLAKMEAA